MKLLTPDDIECQEFDYKYSMLTDREWYSAVQVDDFLEGPVMHTIDTLSAHGVKLRGQILKLQLEVERLTAERDTLLQMVGAKADASVQDVFENLDFSETDDVKENDCE